MMALPLRFARWIRPRTLRRDGAARLGRIAIRLPVSRSGRAGSEIHRENQTRVEHPRSAVGSETATAAGRRRAAKTPCRGEQAASRAYVPGPTLRDSGRWWSARPRSRDRVASDLITWEISLRDAPAHAPQPERTPPYVQASRRAERLLLRWRIQHAPLAAQHRCPCRRLLRRWSRRRRSRRDPGWSSVGRICNTVHAAGSLVAQVQHGRSGLAAAGLEIHDAADTVNMAWSFIGATRLSSTRLSLAATLVRRGRCGGTRAGRNCFR